MTDETGVDKLDDNFHIHQGQFNITNRDLKSDMYKPLTDTLSTKLHLISFTHRGFIA